MSIPPSPDVASSVCCMIDCCDGPPSIIMLCMLSLPNDGIMLKHPADRQNCRGPLVSRIRQPCSPCGLAHSQSPCTSMQSFHACQRHPGAVSLGETSLWRYTRACTDQACGLRLHNSPTNLIRSSPAQQHAESRWRCRARTEDAESTDTQSTHQSDSSREIEPKQRRRKTDTPDFISSALTRRFGWVFTVRRAYMLVLAVHAPRGCIWLQHRRRSRLGWSPGVWCDIGADQDQDRRQL